MIACSQAEFCSLSSPGADDSFDFYYLLESHRSPSQPGSELGVALGHLRDAACDNPKEEVAAADFPEIRFFQTGRLLADLRQEDCEGEWAVCTPRTVGTASGVAYFFSRKIHREVGVPVGAVQSFWSSSRVVFVGSFVMPFACRYPESAKTLKYN